MTNTEIKKAINEAVNNDTLSCLHSSYTDKRVDEMFEEEFRNPAYLKFAICGSLAYNHPLQIQKVRRHIGPTIT